MVTQSDHLTALYISRGDLPRHVLASDEGSSALGARHASP
jgi:hypothetical protein